MVVSTSPKKLSVLTEMRSTLTPLGILSLCNVSCRLTGLPKRPKSLFSYQIHFFALNRLVACSLSVAVLLTNVCWDGLFMRDADVNSDAPRVPLAP